MAFLTIVLFEGKRNTTKKSNECNNEAREEREREGDRERKDRRHIWPTQT